MTNVMSMAHARFPLLPGLAGCRRLVVPHLVRQCLGYRGESRSGVADRQRHNDAVHAAGRRCPLDRIVYEATQVDRLRGPFSAQDSKRSGAHSLHARAFEMAAQASAVAHEQWCLPANQCRDHLRFAHLATTSLLPGCNGL
jgi:hypothetical protein